MGLKNNNTENVLLLMHSQDKVCWPSNVSPPKAGLTCIPIVIASEGGISWGKGIYWNFWASWRSMQVEGTLLGRKKICILVTALLPTRNGASGIFWLLWEPV